MYNGKVITLFCVLVPYEKYEIRRRHKIPNLCCSDSWSLGCQVCLDTPGHTLRTTVLGPWELHMGQTSEKIPFGTQPEVTAPSAAPKTCRHLILSRSSLSCWRNFKLLLRHTVSYIFPIVLPSVIRPSKLSPYVRYRSVLYRVAHVPLVTLQTVIQSGSRCFSDATNCYTGWLTLF